MKFLIEVVTNKVYYNKKLEKEMPYFTNSEGEVYYDKVIFNKNKISIIGTRTTMNSPEKMLETINSTHYIVLLKSLIFVFFTKGSFTVEKIEIKVNDINPFEYKNDKLIQNFTDLGDLELLSEDSLSLIFKHLKKSDILLSCLMNIILSTHFKEHRFEYLWKCFNIIYRELSGKQKDFEGLICIRKKLEEEPEKFMNTIALSDKVTVEDLSDRRIIAMINNNYPKGSNNEKNNVINFLNEFEDSRVNKILLEKMECKKKVLDDKYNHVRENLELKIDKNEKNNIDIIRFLVLKYSYFLRNKYFHGEKFPLFTLIKNTNHADIDYICKFLFAINLDLLSFLD